MPTGPGAADDASGAAILLKTARALKSETPLRNDVIFLFTDGEETGLFGAKTWDATTPKHLAVLALCALPGIILLAPVIQMIFTALSFAANLIVAVFVALLCVLLILQLKIVSAARAWLLPLGAAAAGAVLLLYASYATSYTAACPRPSNLFYALNGNAGTAVWASGYDDDGPDAWAAQYLTASAAKGALADYVPQRHSNFVSHEAPPSQLAPPSIELLGDATADGVRTLRLRVTSPRQAPVMTVYMDSEVHVRGASVDGRKIDDGEPAAPSEDQPRWRLNYYGFPKQGVELTLEMDDTKPLKIWVMDQSYGLPEIPGASNHPRPEWIKPAAWRLYSDQTLVDKSSSFDELDAASEERFCGGKEFEFYGHPDC